MRGEGPPCRKHRNCTAPSTKSADDSSRVAMNPSAVYRDFALASNAAILKIVEPPQAKRRGPRGGVQIPFPNRLFTMLEAVHQEGLEDIVSWQSHGRSFIVRKPTQFEARILPRFFAQTKMSSFQRQLNLYGFLRQNTGQDRGSYYHELFLRGRPDLPKIMVRTRVKGIGMGRTNKLEKEPDFYKMTPSVLKSDKEIALESKSTPENETTEEPTPQEAAPSTPQGRETGTQHLSPFEAPPAPRNAHRTHMPSMEWIRSVPGVHPQPINSSFASVVTPMPEDGGRPIFNPGNRVGFSEMAANIADSRMAPYGHPQGTGHNSIFPIRSIPTQELPMMPTTTQIGHKNVSHLQPRYRGNDIDIEDTGLFEGLEFQVVDDDSLEQFESELISDGTESL